MLKSISSVHTERPNRTAMDLYQHSLKTAIGMLRQGRPVKALAQVDASITAYPDRSLGYRVRGLALLQIGRRRRAADAMRRSLQLDPEQHDLAEELGALLLQLDQVSEAESWLRKALAAGREQARPNLVHCLLAQGRLPEAERTVERDGGLAPLGAPTWLVGCGRSGTTALGRTMAAHPEVTYLNEPHHCWAYDPDNMIWGDGQGQLVREPPFDGPALSRVRRAMRVASAVGGGRQLVEKLPVNAFRIPYLLALAPESRFVWITREPVEVASSIARCTEAGTWYQGRKWGELVKLARRRRLPERWLRAAEPDPYFRGLLEWRLANAMVLEQAPRHATLHLTYAQLLEDPAGCAARLAHHMHLEDATPIATFARERLQRIHPAPARRLGPLGEAIVEPVLSQIRALSENASAPTPARR